jgi:ABC-type transport system involved in multi-copper enzyme maturation permease subunit
VKAARRFSGARLASISRAEFLKIWASNIPLVMLVALPVGSYLFVLDLYHGERISDHLHIGNALDVFPLLFFATWKTSLFQVAMLTFAAFWATVDSQYGMIRVACCQPVSRVEYLLGKWCGITAHVVIFTIMLVASELAWTAIYSGVHGVREHDLASIARFTVELLTFVVALTSVWMATASCRRTVGAGIVTALMVFILLAFMTMLPFGVLSPRLVLMRYFFFPFGELRNPFPAAVDSAFLRVHSVADFCRVVLLTPLLFVLPAIVYFRNRDIVE